MAAAVVVVVVAAAAAAAAAAAVAATAAGGGIMTNPLLLPQIRDKVRKYLNRYIQVRERATDDPGLACCLRRACLIFWLLRRSRGFNHCSARTSRRAEAE